jgi:hypothetical protein
MKACSCLILLYLFAFSINSFAQDSDEQQLWLITARISHNSTFQSDTASSFSAGDQKWERESHQTGKTTASGTITAVVENQAENPVKDFLYHSDSGDPVSITVTGQGSMFQSSNSQETIDGILISKRTRTDNASGSAWPGASLYFEYSEQSKSFDVTITIKAVGSYTGRMYSGGRGFGEWTDYGEEIKNYSIHFGGSGDALTDKNCRMIKSGKGYQGSWKESASKRSHDASGPEYRTSETSIEITVEPYKESDKPEVTLAGCSELEVGGQSMVVATAKPVGGTFRFWAEPSSMLNVETDGSSANLTGATPGKGTLFVEYTTPEGKTNQTSQAASCVKVENYNGGQPIPQIALYDIDGKKQSGIKTVSVQAQPADACDLVKFEPADPGVLSAVGTGSEVTLQGLQVGTTTLQAKTNCGEKTGPEVEVEVVKCDEETIKTLERMREAATENLIEASEKMQKDASSEEFQEARDELVKSTEELLLKSGLTILSSGHVHGSAETAIEIAEAAESAIELMGSADSKQFAGTAMLTILKALGTSITKAAAGAVGVHEAAKKFGEIVGEILKHEDVMEADSKNFEQAYRNLERIAQRQQFCKGEKTEKPKKEEPKPEPKSEPTKPKPPTKPDPKTGEPPTLEPQPDDPASDDEVFVDPEPPTIPPVLVGLPYEPESCGCSSGSKVTNNSKGFAEIGKGVKNLGNCVDKFQNTSLTDYQNALQEMTQLTDSLTSELASDTAGFAVKAKESQSRFGSLVSRVKSYDKAGNEFLKTMDKCPQSVTSGMEIFKSVETITIDSIKTHY